MDTLNELQKIGPGQFETLVLQYLRRRDTQLYGLIAAGINEEDRFTSCRVDGILYYRVSSDLPVCIAVGCNVYQRDKLRGKWLGTAKEKGDIQNAAEEFQKLRLDEPRIICKLYLATNKRLLKSNKDLDLARDAINKGKDNGIEIQFVEASQLEDFLNIDIDGQYIGEELLQIPAKRLSENLLQKIADYSLSQHQLTFGIGQNEPGKEIIRDALSQVMAVLEQSTAALLGLRGASGTGKSTLLRQVGREINKRGGIALWVPAEEILPNTSISNLLLRVLQRFHPSLNRHAGDDAMRLAQQVPGGLVLLVDDVNRLLAPQQALDAIEVWEGLASGRGMSGSQSSYSWLRFVVPLWLGQLAAQPELPTQENAKWEFVAVHSYSELEKARLASLLSESDPKAARQVIDALNGDPFLCGLASADIAIPLGSRSDLIRRNFEDFLDRATKAVRTNKEIATPKEFVTAVEKLVELMLWAEEPEPQWEQVREALGDRAANLLLVLAKMNMLGWIDQSESCEFWRWKHNRLRDALVGRWLANRVLPQILEGNLSGEIQTWLSDPGLAEAWALALVFLSKANIRAKALTVISEYQPLSLTEVLRLNLFPNESNLHQLIAKGLRQTLISSKARACQYVNSPQNWILLRLAQTDNTTVLNVTEDLPPDWYVWAARLRNGDISAGLEFINDELAKGVFFPRMEFSLIEQALEAFVTLHDCNRDEVVNQLVQVMKQPEFTVAAITFAGYLAWPELSRPVWDTWNTLSHSDSEKLVATVPTIWALSRGGDDSIQSELEKALLFTRELNELDRLNREQGRGNIPHGRERLWKQWSFQLGSSLRWSITPLAAKTWVKVIDKDSEIRNVMWGMLRRIDHSTAIEAYIKWGAIAIEAHMQWLEDESNNLDKNIRGELLLSEILCETVAPLTEQKPKRKALVNRDTRERLWEIAEDNKSDVIKRAIAFTSWKQSATGADMECLQKIPPSDQLFEDVLKVRLRLRDKTAAKPLIERMQSRPGYWCSHAPLLYDATGVPEALLDNLELALDEPTGWSNAIAKHLPAEGVRELVRKKQDLLLKSPHTWLALWCSDVPEALSLVQKAMIQAKLDDLIPFFYPSNSFAHPISQRMLDALVPALEHLPLGMREQLAERAAQGGHGEWVQEHLPDLATTGQVRYFFPTTEDVIAALTANVKVITDGVMPPQNTEEYGYVQWLLRLNRIGSSGIDLPQILQTWLGSSPDQNQVIVAAMLLETSGTSRDLSWWQNIEPKDEPARTAWSNILYFLKRRRWQKVREFSAVQMSSSSTMFY
jgi:hypothetical protein